GASLKDPHPKRVSSHGKEESLVEEETHREESRQARGTEEDSEEESRAQARRRQASIGAQEDRAAHPRAAHAAVQPASAGAARQRTTGTVRRRRGRAWTHAYPITQTRTGVCGHASARLGREAAAA